MSEEGEVTRILARLKRGEVGAVDELFARVFGELHALARMQMAEQHPGHTLQPTALVNEVYVKLFRGTEPTFVDRNHFLRVASRAMRCILVDHARERNCLKRTAPGERLPIEELSELFQERARDLPALDEALARLARIDPRAVEVIELRFFGGRSEEETAETLGVSLRTVERDWRAARAWLLRELS